MVSATLMRFVSPCWKTSVSAENSSRNNDTSGRTNGLLWYKDSGTHVNGEYSMAVIQANTHLEDQCQLESGPLSSTIDSSPQGTFVGVYDGHGGPEASKFVNDHLFNHLKRLISENHGVSCDVINRAFLATEEDFLSLVREQWLEKPQIASVGSCCLVGIICGGLLYIANAGDSRVVLGRTDRFKDCKAVQLSSEHNASLESVRDDLRSAHPHDPNIVVLKHKVWRVKGLIQVSRSLGDAYLKRPEFNREPLLAKFRLPESFGSPILKAEPAITEHKLCPEDQFLIFASDGLWEHLTNQEAVDIVRSSPRNVRELGLISRVWNWVLMTWQGVARKLVKAALREAAKKREMRYSDLKKIDRGVRRHFHDDITVIVLFIDIHGNSFRGTLLSIAGGSARRNSL